MKNEFQQLVDRRLSGLQWDERRTLRVLRALEPEGGTIMKRKMTLSIALVAAIVLMASIALAAVTLVYSPSVSALTQARNALIDQYGLTHTTLGLFTHSASFTEDAAIITFRSGVADEFAPGAAGEYTVTLRDGEVIASWTHDEADPALWQSGDLTSPVWGQPQLETFLREKTDGGTVVDDPNDSAVLYTVSATSTPAPVMEEGLNITIDIADVTPSPDDLSEAEARALASAALMETFDLPEDDMARVTIKSCRLRQFGSYEPRVWLIHAECLMDSYDWNMFVELDASTGEILDVSMQTGGNG